MEGAIKADIVGRDRQWLRDQAKRETVKWFSPKRVEFEGGEDKVVAAVAGKLGIGGESFEVMAQTWLRPIVDEGLGSTRSGLNRGRMAVKFLGMMMSGTRHRKAMEAVGLKWNEISAFRFVCPDFDRLYQIAYAMMKQNMGKEVLDAVYDAAVNGTERKIRDKDGNVVDVERVVNTKAMEMMMPLAGEEFRKDRRGGASVQGGDGGGG